jgi:hypothetical protein
MIEINDETPLSTFVEAPHSSDTALDKWVRKEILIHRLTLVLEMGLALFFLGLLLLPSGIVEQLQLKTSADTTIGYISIGLAFVVNLIAVGLDFWYLRQPDRIRRNLLQTNARTSPYKSRRELIFTGLLVVIALRESIPGRANIYWLIALLSCVAYCLTRWRRKQYENLARLQQSSV